jgi:hypothetical protein
VAIVFFAKCPQFAKWAGHLVERLPSRDLDSGARSELLTNAVLDQVHEITSTSRILELRDSERNRVFPNVPNYSHWGTWSEKGKRPANLFFRTPTALNWLAEHNGEAYKALGVLYKLVNDHQATAFTQQEREEIATKQILGKEYARHAR